MGRHAYTPEQNAWIAERYPTTPNRELAEAFSAEFGEPSTMGAMHAWGANHGMRKEPWVRPQAARRYTDEQLDFLRRTIPGRPLSETADLYEAEYGRRLPRTTLRNLCAKLGVRCGVNSGRFASGHEPANKGRPWSEWMSEAGAERSRSTQFRPGTLNGIAAERDYGLLGVRIANGYRMIRVDPREQANTMSRWIPLAAFNWMQANGQDWPEGHKALHIDRDPLNDEADNIEPVPVGLWPLVMGAVPGQLAWHDRETLRTAILYARVTRARQRAARDARRAAGRPWKQDMD